jgi:phospholipid-translocating ATPase
MLKFFEILTICHTVQVDNNFKEKFQATSPDEFCLIKFCEKIGIIYEGEQRKKDGIIRLVRYGDNVHKQYELLHLFEFDSTRKRMSIIIRALDTDRIFVLCKGADNHIFERCLKGDIQDCDRQITYFAQKGWRTLAFAYRELCVNEMSRFDELIMETHNSHNSKNKKLSEIVDEIEKNMILVGATAIEDKLQEECAETLEALRLAGIKIWVLTGDKTETAINISNSCRHFTPDMIRLDLMCIQEEELDEKLENFKLK